eukprot:XP_011671612.1 PREDICTED: uncharacterized protein LOC105441811 [Strongylocentrotus purpuratus]
MIERMSGSTDDTMITPEEAFDFVRDALCIPAPSTKFEASPKDFLQDLLRAYFHHIPFQNLKNIATPHRKRHVPTVAEIKLKRLGLMSRSSLATSKKPGTTRRPKSPQFDKCEGSSAIGAGRRERESRCFAQFPSTSRTSHLCTMSPSWFSSFPANDDVISFVCSQVGGHPAKQTMEAFLSPMRMSGSTDDTMITPEEAFDFVRDALCIPAPSTKFEASPKDFLQDLLRAYFHHIPFQNVKNIATPHRKRHVPSVADIKQDILTDKIGGLYYQQNVFFYLLLQALGFDVTLIACDIEKPSDHAALIVHNLTSEGSRHWRRRRERESVFCAVPFDFKDESPVYP